MTLSRIAKAKVGSSVYVARRAIEIDRLAYMRRGFWARLLGARKTFPSFGTFEV